MGTRSWMSTGWLRNHPFRVTVHFDHATGPRPSRAQGFPDELSALKKVTTEPEAGSKKTQECREHSPQETQKATAWRETQEAGNSHQGRGCPTTPPQI